MRNKTIHPFLISKNFHISTFNTACDSCFAAHWNQNRSWNGRLFIVKSLIKFFGKTRSLATIDTKAVAELTHYLRHTRRLTESSITRHLIVLRKILGHAHKTGLTLSTPTKIRPPRLPKYADHKPRFLTLDEEMQFFKLCDDNYLTKEQWRKFKVLVSLCLYTGNLPNRLMQIKTPIKELILGNYLPASPEYRLLKQHISLDPYGSSLNPHCGLLVPEFWEMCKSDMDDKTTLQDLLGMSDSHFSIMWDTIKEQMGLKDDVSFNLPRIVKHSCVIRLVLTGASPNTIHDWMGFYRFRTTTLRYVCLAYRELLEWKKNSSKNFL